MTVPGEHLQEHQHAIPPTDHREAVLPDPVETTQAVQQLRAAGFSDDQQAVLTTAVLRVLALWTQQATREDVQAELRAGEQRLAQRLEALRDELHRVLGQHADAVRAEVQELRAQQEALVQAARTVPTRWWAGPPWLVTGLLGLTCAGVLVLVVHRLLGW